ncbi:MAG: hypothetical protein JWQ74_3503 [Marmoricola sp.]|nr:hypothetical protein [Marmoricola sp.]
MTSARQQSSLVKDLVRAVGAANVLTDLAITEGFRRDLQSLADDGIPSPP